MAVTAERDRRGSSCPSVSTTGAPKTTSPKKSGKGLPFLNGCLMVVTLQVCFTAKRRRFSSFRHKTPSAATER